MKKIVNFKRAFFLLLILCSPLALANNVVDKNLVGIWQVKHVYIDTSLMSSPGTLPDDPFLVGRTLDFSQNKINGQMLVDEGCTQPALSTQPATTFNKLLISTFGAPENGLITDNYLLPYKAETAVTPMVVTCSAGLFGPEGESIGSWLTLINGQTMMVNWDNNALVTLEKVPANAQPKPSFNCQHATIASEKKICSSFDLAAWDSSVNDAYKMVEAEYKRLDKAEELSALKNGQRKWLTERNNCNNDADCLSKKMADRVLDLTENFK